jgi:outer membrane protein TolC
MYNEFTGDQMFSTRRLRKVGIRSALVCGGLLAASIGSAAAAGAAAAAPAVAVAGEVRPGATLEQVVDDLVGDALNANLEFDAATLQVTQRLAQLDQARARYLPAIDLTARYTRADAGRTLEFPVGDLLNPVYAQLNQLTGGTHFAPVANQQIDFQRPREQQTALALTQPLYDARISAAHAAARADYDASESGRRALAGRLQRDMRVAYYRWLQARAQVEIFTATRELALENQRVNDSLFKNGKITRDLVYRAEADELEIEQSLLAQQASLRLAQSYVNLLRNSPFDRTLPLPDAADPDGARLRGELEAYAKPAALAELQDRAVGQRAELRELEANAAAAAAGERLARAAFKPQLALAVEYGIQGVDYGVGSDERYLLASVVLKFSFFSGGGDQAGIAGSHAAWRAAQTARDIEAQQIRFQVQQALQDLEVTRATLDTADKRVAAAAGAFRIAARKRDLGQINQAEFIDARRSRTDAELNSTVTRFAALANLAELEYALGSRTHRLTTEISP